MAKRKHAVVGECTDHELDIKRLYLPGIIVKSACPKCGIRQEQDLDENYISSPTLGEVEEIYFSCDREVKDGKYCEGEWSVPIVLELKVRLATEEEAGGSTGAEDSEDDQNEEDDFEPEEFED